MDTNNRYSDSDSSESHDCSFYSVTKSNKQQIHDANKKQDQESELRHSNSLNAQSELNGQPLMNVGGLCTVCRKSCISQCERCADYYCSVTCQKRDWHSHRYICFPIPNLVLPRNLNPTMFVNMPNLGRMDNSYCKTLAQQRGVPLTDNDRKENPNSQNPIRGGSVANSQVKEPKQNTSSTQPIPTKKNVNTSHQVTANQKVLENAPSNVPNPRNHSCVILTALRSTNSCYIRSSNPSDIENYNSVINKIQECGVNMSKLTNPPILWSYAITVRNNSFHRVQVIPSERRDHRYRVSFIDLGITEFRSFKELYEISETLLTLPCYLKSIRLNGVNYVKEDKLRKHLSEFENREYKIIWIKEGYEAKLLHWRTDKPLADDIKHYINLYKVTVSKEGNKKIELNETNNAEDSNVLKQETPTRKSSSVVDEQCTALDKKNKVLNAVQKNNLNNLEKNQNVQKKETLPNSNDLAEQPPKCDLHQPCMEPPFKTIYFPKSATNFTAIALDNGSVEAGFVGCLIDSHMNNLIGIQKYLSHTYKDNGIPYEPKLKEYCIAKYEKDWYRAKVTNIKSRNEYTVFYIDFANELTVSSAEIRPYPMELTDNCTTNLCFIKDLPNKMSKRQIEFLKEELGFRKAFHIDRIYEVTGGTVGIICSELIEKVKSQ